MAVFIPLLMMGGIVGRLFREFAVTLSVAIGVSLVVSLTTTPTMCAKFLRPAKRREAQLFLSGQRMAFRSALAIYSRMLNWVLAYQPVMLMVTILVACSACYLYYQVPKGFFPQQDTGRIMGAVMRSSGYFVPVDEPRRCSSYVEHRDEGSGGRYHGWIRRREYRAEPRTILHDAEAAGTARAVQETTLLGIVSISSAPTT